MKKRLFWTRSLPKPPADDPTVPWWVSRALIIDYPTPPGLLSIFLSTLRPGRMPHDIHTHAAAELMVLLDGDMDVISDQATRRMGPGSFFYADPNRMHTMTCLGSTPARFVVLKWKPHPHAALPDTPPPPELPWLTFDAVSLPAWDGEQALNICPAHPLPYGGKLRVNMLRVEPNSRCDAHRHDHDVLLVLLQGALAGASHASTAPAIVYYPAGTAHHLAPQNGNTVLALAFEFHGAIPERQPVSC